MIDLSINQPKGSNIMSESHFMDARDAYAIAFNAHIAIVKQFNDNDNGYSGVNSMTIDAINHYYSLMMQFAKHSDFIDSCAFDSMVELDNVLELQTDHDILEWDMDMFIAHYKHDIRAMHHYRSLDIHGMNAMHARDICAYCTPDENFCCMGEASFTVAFTITDIF